MALGLSGYLLVTVQMYNILEIRGKLLPSCYDEADRSTDRMSIRQ